MGEECPHPIKAATPLWWFRNPRPEEIQAGHKSSYGDQEIPEVFQPSYPEIAILSSNTRDLYQDLYSRDEVSIRSHHGSPGGCRGLPGDSVRGHSALCHPCQEGDRHAQGYAASKKNQRREY